MDIQTSSGVKNNSFAKFFGGIEPDSTEFIFEDEQCVVFEEQNNKQAPVHFLVVPKKSLKRLGEATEDDEVLLGHLLITARRIAKLKGIDNTGFRVVVNEGGHSSQAIDQLYLQVFGGRQMLRAFC